jgi:hypothetical protein
MIVPPPSGLTLIDLPYSKENPAHNRGFAFLEFYNATCAQAAKIALSNPGFK